MTIRVAINGFGRIGRNVLRAHYEDGKKNCQYFSKFHYFLLKCYISLGYLNPEKPEIFFPS